MSGFRTLPKADAAALEPFGKVLADWADKFDRMPDEELHDLIRACDRLTDSNCWWAVWGARGVVRTLATWELERRGSLARWKLFRYLRLGAWGRAAVRRPASETDDGGEG